MRSVSVLTVLAILASTLCVQGGSRSDVLRGGLVGAATGALVSGLSSDISSRTAIPLFAGLGALTGYSMHNARNRDYYYAYTPDWHYTYSIHPYAHPIGYRHRWHRPPHYMAPPVRVAPVTHTARNSAASRPVNNRHPGVVRIPIELTTTSGFPLTITITKAGNQYVGPRGEIYPEMPAAIQLQQIYKP